MSNPEDRPNVKRRLVQMRKIHKRGYRMALALKSRQQAIWSFCRECTGWDRESVRHCPDDGCPLWGYRPYQ